MPARRAYEVSGPNIPNGARNALTSEDNNSKRLATSAAAGAPGAAGAPSGAAGAAGAPTAAAGALLLERQHPRRRAQQLLQGRPLLQGHHRRRAQLPCAQCNSRSGAVGLARQRRP